MEHQIETNEKIKANAISAYLLFFISALFLVNKHNPYLANEFVHSHTKTANLIHIGFLAVMIIFLWYDLGYQIQIVGIGLNHILATAICIGLFTIMLYGIYKAHKGERFTTLEAMRMTKMETLIDIHNSQHAEEKDKLGLILTLIPYIGFIVAPHHKDNIPMQNIAKTTTYITLLISCIFVLGTTNLGFLLGLIYIIFAVFTGIILIGKDELMSFDLKKFFNFGNSEIYLKSAYIYFKNYFKKSFTPLSEIYQKVLEEQKAIFQENTKNLDTKKAYPLPGLLIYIPIINLINIFFLGTKKYFHILNGISLSTLFILSWLIFGFTNMLQILLFIPLFYGIGYMGVDDTYTLPVIGSIGKSAATCANYTKNIFTTGRKLSKKTQEVSIAPQKSETKKK